jgi:hypothetical protein
VGLVLSGAGVGAAHLDAFLLGELHRVTRRLGRIQPHQAGGDALSVSGGDLRSRNQRDQGRGAEKKAGVLHGRIFEEGHGDVFLFRSANSLRGGNLPLRTRVSEMVMASTPARHKPCCRAIKKRATKRSIAFLVAEARPFDNGIFTVPGAFDRGRMLELWNGWYEALASVEALAVVIVFVVVAAGVIVPADWRR